MKRNILLLFAISTLALLSCNKEASENTICFDLETGEIGELSSSSYSDDQSSSTFSSSNLETAELSSSSRTSSYSSEYVTSTEEEYEKELLPIGNYTVPGPENKNNRDEILGGTEYCFNNSLPSYWSFIMGNNKVKTANNYYADGSVKFSHLWYGLQTPYIKSYKKIKITFYISQVNNSSDKKKDDQPIFHIYGYDENQKYIQVDYLDQGRITKQTEGNSCYLYVRNINIAYLEIRLNANPYKNSQCYNFGVNKIKLEGWNYD